MAAIYPVPTERPSKVRILGHDLTQQGFRWSVEIAEKLESASFGMLCITADNLDAPWLLFEAGALAKKLNRPNVCPYLIDLKPSDLQGPLSQFQACEFTKADTLKLLHSMNEALSQRALPIAQIDRAFDKWWPDFEIALSAKHTSAVMRKPLRSDREILEELIGRVRRIDEGINYRKTDNKIGGLFAPIREAFSSDRTSPPCGSGWTS